MFNWSIITKICCQPTLFAIFEILSTAVYICFLCLRKPYATGGYYGFTMSRYTDVPWQQELVRSGGRIIYIQINTLFLHFILNFSLISYDLG